MKPGKFISIEGTEGAGKSTVIQFIKNFLSNAGIDALWTREPGGTPLAEEIRQILLRNDLNETLTAKAELLLMFASREQHVMNKIVPALNAGKWVVSDRYIDASYAYQGGGRQIDSIILALIDEWVVGAHYPELTLLLDVPPEIGLKRAEQRGNVKDRIEHEKIDFFNRVRATYLARAKENSTRIKIIDASVSLDLVEKQINKILNAFIKEHL